MERVSPTGRIRPRRRRIPLTDSSLAFWLLLLFLELCTCHAMSTPSEGGDGHVGGKAISFKTAAAARFILVPLPLAPRDASCAACSSWLGADPNAPTEPAERPLVGGYADGSEGLVTWHLNAPSTDIAAVHVSEFVFRGYHGPTPYSGRCPPRGSFVPSPVALRGR